MANFIIDDRGPGHIHPVPVNFETKHIDPKRLAPGSRPAVWIIDLDDPHATDFWGMGWIDDDGDVHVG